MSVNQIERRRFPRIKFSNPLCYHIRGLSNSYTNTISDNISVNGLGFINNDFIAPNTNIMLEMNIHSRAINTAARVVRSSPLPHTDRYSLGVEFLEFNDTDKIYLQDYINMQQGMQ